VGIIELVKTRVPLALTILWAGFSGIGASAATVYSTLPSALPSDFGVSLGYAASSVLEFGELVQTGDPRNLTLAKIGLSNFAYSSVYPNFGNGTGYDVGMTLTLYNKNSDGSVGSSFAASSTTVHILWRPEPGGGCANNGYLAGIDCLSGQAQAVSFGFDFVTLPDQFIYGLAFSTGTGPVNALNIGFNGDPTVGSNPSADFKYFNATTGGLYTDGGTGGLGTFRQDPGWAGLGFGSVAAEFDAVAATPEPATFGLIGFGLVALSVVARKKKRGV
jgi:hypothetical protein